MFNEREASSELLCGGGLCSLSAGAHRCGLPRFFCVRSREGCLRTGRYACARPLAALGCPESNWVPWPVGKKEQPRTLQQRLSEASEALLSPRPASCIPVAREPANSAKPSACHSALVAVASTAQAAVKSSIAAAHTHRTDAVDALPEFSRQPGGPEGSPKYGNHPHRWPTSSPRRRRRR